MKTLFRAFLLTILAIAAAGTASAGTLADLVGDINGDGVVNVLDIQAAIAQALQTAPEIAQADIDGNSLVDISDIQHLINTTLGTGGLVQRVKGVLAAPESILQAGVTLAAVSQEGDQVVAAVDPVTGAFMIKLPVRKAWSFAFATQPDVNGAQETGAVQFVIAGTVSTVLPLAELSLCDVLDLGTLTFGPVISVTADIRDLLAHINRQDLLVDADGNGIPDFLDKLLDRLPSLPGLACAPAADGKMMPRFNGLPCIDLAAIKDLIRTCVAGNLNDITEVSLVDTNGNRIPDFLEPVLACLGDGIKTWLQQNGISLPDPLANLVMNAIGQHLPALLGELRMPRLTDTNGDGIPDNIRFGIGNMHLPPAMDRNGNGIPDFLEHRLPNGGEGEGEAPVQLVAVPDLSGMTLTDAQAAVSAAGLPLGAVGHQFSATVPADSVIGQRPEAGKNVPPNTPVMLMVSLGALPQPVAVPNVVGMSQADAQSAITAAGLSVGMMGQMHDAAIAQGQVIRQFPSSGAMVPPGSPVNFLVSLGAAAV